MKATGERWERRRWREERPERVAAVEKFEDQRKPEEFFGHRNSSQYSVFLSVAPIAAAAP